MGVRLTYILQSAKERLRNNVRRPK